MLREILTSIHHNRRLILAMTRRELFDRYAGQLIGASWSVLHPLLLVLVYVAIFGVVFRARIDLPGLPDSYTAYLMSGLFPWLAVIDAMARSTQAIASNSALVKQIVFPNEVLVMRCVLAALFGQLVATAVALMYMVVAVGSIPIIAIVLPVVVVVHTVFVLGLCYFVATVGVFVRDMKDFVQAFGAFGMYLAPIVFLPGWLPKPAEYVLMLNPFSHMVWVFQDLLFFGAIRHPASWLVFPILAFGLLILGRRMFKRFEHSFANLM